MGISWTMADGVVCRCAYTVMRMCTHASILLSPREGWGALSQMSLFQIPGQVTSCMYGMDDLLMISEPVSLSLK